MPKMRAAQIARPGGAFEIVEREIPQPAAGWVRVKVQACGNCHSDSLVKEGHWPGLQYPHVPGHEVAGGRGCRGQGCVAMETGRLGICLVGSPRQQAERDVYVASAWHRHGKLWKTTSREIAPGEAA